MRLRITGVFILILLFASHINAQPFIALSSGISTDLNNKSPFYAVPFILKMKPFKRSGFFIEVSQGIGFNRLSQADAYSINSQLSEHVVLTEAVKFTSFSVGIGGAIVLYTNKKNNQFVLSLSTGVSDENYKVTYRNYDKVNYEVLNPDVARDVSGLYASIAGIYNFHKRKRDMFIMLRLQSPTLSAYSRYKLSYNKAAPLQLAFGYKLFYTKK
jgi:hypothetical protein